MGNVFANMREVSAKKDGNKSICAMMSVCLSPPSPPAGPIPIPYPVTDMASNTANGTGSVYVQKKEVGKQNASDYKKCNGNQPATRSFGMDVVSHTLQGKTKFEMYSFDVKFENKGAERLLDLTSTNHMNPATAFTASAAGGAPPDMPTDDDCKALETQNAEYRTTKRGTTGKTNDQKVIKTRKDGTKVTFSESGTVTSGAFLPEGGTAARRFTGVSATRSLQTVKGNLCQSSSVPGTPKPDDDRTKTYVDNSANRKRQRVGDPYTANPASYKLPFCPGDPYEHPGGGLQGHAELNILNNVPQPTTQKDRLLLKIDWNHDGTKGDDRPCTNCQKAIAAACKCMTIIICTKDNEPVDRCTKPYKREETEQPTGAEILA